jgi:hypothetical protein
MRQKECGNYIGNPVENPLITCGKEAPLCGNLKKI